MVLFRWRQAASVSIHQVSVPTWTSSSVSQHGQLSQLCEQGYSLLFRKLQVRYEELETKNMIFSFNLYLQLWTTQLAHMLLVAYSEAYSDAWLGALLMQILFCSVVASISCCKMKAEAWYSCACNLSSIGPYLAGLQMLFLWTKHTEELWNVSQQNSGASTTQCN